MEANCGSGRSILKALKRVCAIYATREVVMYQVRGTIGARAEVTYRTQNEAITRPVVLPWSVVLYDLKPDDELRLSARYVAAGARLTAEIFAQGKLVDRVVTLEPSALATAQGVLMR